jgi:hypothetical protein
VAGGRQQQRDRRRHRQLLLPRMKNCSFKIRYLRWHDQNEVVRPLMTESSLKYEFVVTLNAC